MTAPTGHLSELAAAVLQPGFVGTTPPPWVCRWLGEGLGSVVLFARNVVDTAQVAALTATLRAERPDVIVAIDEEAGDVTRIESARGSSRPGNFALGAVDDPELTEAVARDLGIELAAAGITLDYAPDADVNSNPENPVIGVRSFGADPRLVARHTAAWVRGLQAGGVAGCAKHFPGHGDTRVDSHHDLPRITADRERLDACELAPFRAAIAAGVQAVMTGHLLVPALDEELPATLSHRILGGLLRDELGFSGVVVTDAVEMRAVADRYGFAGAAVRALAAGADAICIGGERADEQAARELRDAIVAAVVSGELPEERLAEAAKRVGQLAAWTVAARNARPGAPRGGSDVGLVAARRAVRLTTAPAGRETLPLTRAAYVVEFEAPRNIAIGAETPWGIGEPLGDLLPGTTTVRYGEPDVPADPGVTAGDRPLVLVVRDLHRHEWMRAAVHRALAARPDGIVVELGVPELVTGAVHLATHSGTQASGQAAAETLTGRLR
ncbi:glycoside hydrolase family 3 protein [Micromonospora profundi]|uniref:Glycoside hydrolase family 3 N-terminal domain-containing protein n=1 Tax=Micromonospora profundi TaxID=1420889 RepID=A0AAJ6HRT6_9ACTN|nr:MULTISPECIES: glycoside hydrolase family 3 N-terminal domain-containing protein [Micromonospora]NJC13428.1 beta-N-acetylhexosaminidase [Micromonospora profundi]WLS45027.1 glycoside hydrolase family 3 N-terminal domain-containing protein [Micromonospora profundi]